MPTESNAAPSPDPLKPLRELAESFAAIGIERADNPYVKGANDAYRNVRRHITDILPALESAIAARVDAAVRAATERAAAIADDRSAYLKNGLKAMKGHVDQYDRAIENRAANELHQIAACIRSAHVTPNPLAAAIRKAGA
jgi:hypothetical protein